MAVTILEPTVNEYWLPSGNPIIFTMSTTTTNTRLSYIIDVYVNGVQRTRLKYAVYNRNELNVDLASVANDYISDAFCNEEIANTFASETCSLQIAVTEEYWDFINQQMVVDVAGQKTSKVVYVWRAAADFQQSRELWNFYENFDLTAHTYNNYGKFLGVKNNVDDVAINTLPQLIGNPPKANPVIFNNLYPISMGTRRTMSLFTTSTFTGTSSHTKYIQVWCFNKNHQLTKRLEKDYHQGQFNTPDFDKKIGAIQVGPDWMNNNGWDNYSLTVAGTTPNIVPAEDRYYFVTVTTNDPNTGGEMISYANPTPDGFKWVGFEIVPCERYDVYNILYKTLEGGWWQIRCNMKHYNETEVKTNIKYNSWQMPAQKTMPEHKRFKQTMHTDANGTITLNTDWIENQGIISEIEEMIVSPQIYLVKDVAPGHKYPVYIPVILKDKSWKIADKQQDKMIQYEFEFEEAYKKNTLI